MASTTTERESAVGSPARQSRRTQSRRRSGPARFIEALADRISLIRGALDRPLTSYYLLLGASALLLTIGLIMVMSASSVYSYRENGDSYAVVKRQLMWVVIGLPVAFVASRMPQRFIRKMVWPALLGSMLLLALTRTPLGLTRNGQTNWLAVGPIAIQPSEIAKLAVILWAAHVYANKQRRLPELHHVMMPVVPGMGLVIALVLLQRDLGTALVLMAIMLSMLWVVGAPARLFALAISVVGVGAFYLATTNEERRGRLLNFVDPFKEYHDAGWQPAHGLYALATGGWFGQGIGASQQKWGDLPEAHTDFIFAVLGEELGLVGTLLVLSLFLTIAYAAIRVATHTRDPFVRYTSFGITIWLLGQMIINVGMVLAMLPVVGIPLPLVSYGGSALLPSLVALGLLIGFARSEPDAAKALAARKRNRSAGLSAGSTRRGN
ncbi:MULTISPECIES: putative lipid II flippase FtsW [unclassified Nocardioides]|uniref:putative lipid II flippase FtsW n=1 Tax=unclassified Nocardioides TaxID=2615069 RepID=UPI001F1C782E|nr:MULTISPECIES: putative lipid II flippase FtsW [unclassified Nocardioides]